MSSAFERLFEAAQAVLPNAHVPYSGFRVAAAIRTGSGRIVAACNVENAAYPQSQCAEASAIGVMVAGGDRRIAELLVIGGQPGDGLLCAPCGGCRQRIREFAGPDVAIHICGPEGLRRTATLGELLPLSFGPENLGAGA